MQFLQIRLVALWRRLDGRLARVPVRGADLAVLILHRPAALLVSCLVQLEMKGRTYSELEGLDEANSLLHGAANREVIHGNLPVDIA